MLLPRTPLFAAYNADFARAFWQSAQLDAQAAAHHHFCLGLIGATVLPWAISMGFVVAIPFARRERWAWLSTAWAVAAWVVAEVALCLWFGVWAELLFIAVAGTGVGVPLLLTRRFFGAPAR